MWDNTIEKRTFPVYLKMDVTAPEENREKLMEMIHGNWVASVFILPSSWVLPIT
jgi:hypothetical protein